MGKGGLVLVPYAVGIVIRLTSARAPGTKQLGTVVGARTSATTGLRRGAWKWRAVTVRRATRCTIIVRLQATTLSVPLLAHGRVMPLRAATGTYPMCMTVCTRMLSL